MESLSRPGWGEIVAAPGVIRRGQKGVPGRRKFLEKTKKKREFYRSGLFALLALLPL